MNSKINISESDRLQILNMHRLLLETKVTITVQGKVNDENNIPLEQVKVVILDSNKKIIKGSLTNESGDYTIDNVDVEPGKYTVKFVYYGKEIIEEVTVGAAETITINKTFTGKVKELEDIEVAMKIYRIPLFNVTVLDSDGNKINDAEIEVYYNDKLIDYGTFVKDGENYKIDNKTKKTTDGSLKNIWINTDKYTDLKDNTKDVCVKKETIKIIAKNKGNVAQVSTFTCLNNAFYTLKNNELKLSIKQEQNFNLTFKFKNTLLFSIIDSKTKNKVGPGTIAIYNDVNKTQYIGKVEINDGGTGSVYFGLNDFGAIKASSDETKVKPIATGEYDIYLYSFDAGYEEFFKKYTVKVKGEGETVEIKVPVDYYEGEDDITDINFNKDSSRRIIYGKSEKKFKTEDEATTDAKKNALEQYISRSKKYKDKTELIGKVPNGGKLVFLHNNEDGTYSAVVKYKRGELRRFVKNYVDEKKDVVKPTPKINFSNITIKDALDNPEGKSVFAFALSNSSSSTEIYNNIISDKKLLDIINNDYVNVKVTNDNNDVNYNTLLTTYKLEFFPTVILFIDKKPYYFNNYRGSIYTQLKDYFKV
jgi:hypothetical protein